MSLSNNRLYRNLHESQYEEILGQIQSGSIKEEHRAINAVFAADFIDGQTKMQFLQLISSLDQLRRARFPIFEAELQLVFESGFELGNDLAQPGVENREEKIKCLVLTIEAVSNWARAGFRPIQRDNLIQVTQTMENTFSPPGFFQFSNPAVRILVGAISLMIGIALLASAPFHSVATAVGLAFNAIGATFLLFAYDGQKPKCNTDKKAIDNTTTVLNNLRFFTRSTLPVVQEEARPLSAPVPT
jgi:hypothetical protein